MLHVRALNRYNGPLLRQPRPCRYGVILVEPPGGLPPVDREYCVVQAEVYAEEGEVRGHVCVNTQVVAQADEGEMRGRVYSGLGLCNPDVVRAMPPSGPSIRSLPPAPAPCPIRTGQGRKALRIKGAQFAITPCTLSPFGHTLLKGFAPSPVPPVPCPTRPQTKGLLEHSFTAGLDERPMLVVFNGAEGALTERGPLQAEQVGRVGVSHRAGGVWSVEEDVPYLDNSRRVTNGKAVHLVGAACVAVFRRHCSVIVCCLRAHKCCSLPLQNS